MRLVIGILLTAIGTIATLLLGFGALMLGGGSTSQAGEAPLYLGGALLGVITAGYGISLAVAHLAEQNQVTHPRDDEQPPDA